MSEPSSAVRPAIRWWPAWAVLALIAGLEVYIWILWSASSRQDRVMSSLAVGFVGALVAIPVLLFACRFSKKLRLWLVAALFVVIGAFFATFRYEGVDGDLLPVFRPRWGSIESEVFGVVSDGVVRGDHSQFLGNSRDGLVVGVTLERDWATRPPRRIWRRPIGAGWSGFAVKGELAITQDQRGSAERVVACDVRTGQEVWTHSDEDAYRSGLAGDGPRATPTIHEDLVITSGATGRLNVLELATGRRLWGRQVFAEEGAATPEWGASNSPLVVDDHVIVSAGGPNGHSLVAYGLRTGEPAWRAGDDRASYSSPLLTTLAGRRQIVSLNAGSVTGHDPLDGRILWSTPWPDRSPAVSQPLPIGSDHLLVSAGYGVGSRVYALKSEGEGLAATVVWQNVRLKSKFANLISHGDFVYGLDDGTLVCVEVATGARRWKSGNYGHGQLLMVGDLLLVQTEGGEAVLIEPSPDEHREVARHQVLENKAWNPPALAGALLFVRNDAEAALWELPTRR